MAAELPVVCSPVGKNVEIVVDGETGFFASTEDEWVERLDALVTSASQRAAMGRAGRQRVEERYSLERAGHEMARWFKAMVQEDALPEEGSVTPVAARDLVEAR
jgi:glycosyltransferase involved in cell wall biosynthesis